MNIVELPTATAARRRAHPSMPEKIKTPDLSFTDKTPDLTGFDGMASIYYRREDLPQLLSALKVLDPHLTFDCVWVFRANKETA
jgi:hypothetical protein